MSPDVLSRQELNRALLDRQLLLRRVPGPADGDRAGQILATVGHLAGLQAQAPFPPYYGLWSRLADFRPDDLAGLLRDRRVVRIALMRGTLHLVRADDALMLRPLLQPVLSRALGASFGTRLGEVDLTELERAGRQLTADQPRTFLELAELLAPRWPGCDPRALAQGVRALVPLVQVPPRAIWGTAGPSRHAPVETWLGRPLNPAASLEDLVRRYLAAFGPASVADMQAWSGLTRLREITDRIGPGLRAFRDESGRQLLDLPDAPRPPAGTPAPARLIAEFDNLVLSHADRSRILCEAHRQRLFTRNGIIPGAILTGGFVTGRWRISTTRGAVTLTVQPFEPISGPDQAAIVAEGERMLSFACPDAPERDIRLEPVTS